MADETKNEEFLGDLKDNAESDPFKPNEDDPFAQIEQKENPAETGETVVKEEEKVEKPLPFHKDPKIQRFIEKEIEKRVPEQKREESQENYFDGVVNAFTEIVGNDTPQKVNALNALKESLNDLDQRATDKAIAQLESVRQQEVAEEKEYEDKLSDGFETIEEETGIDLYADENKKLRVRFIDFVEKVSPKENGEISDLPDIGETFKAFRSIYKTNTQTTKAKELASNSMERSSGEITQPKETGRVSWDNVVDKIREKLGM